MKEKELINQAIAASKMAYAPYSKFHVGAALLLENGEIIQGCNVENASYGLCNCAERTALFTAIAAGHKKFIKLAVYVDRAAFTPPCGACRQVIHELAPGVEILLINNRGEIKRTSDAELLPLSFGSADLEA
ncbi:MAG: cytidine deaminase [Candidatus Riflebacteria bacterium HGW-Riflebacteria-1]|jgi:cytidine deaminase|nr:MAG: cytidine deaminase [Candidatus Riflebacteria bacterium HGW-Riflebacteria-1]